MSPRSRPRAGVLGLSAHHTAVVVGTLAIAPLLFIPSFKKLSWLSAAGCVSTVLVTATVVAAVAIDPSRKGMPVQALPRRRLNHTAAAEATPGLKPSNAYVCAGKQD
jgi:hypothetical protein